MRIISCCLILLAIVLLGGCATNRYNSIGLTGSSSIRVEVEVYKGPLSKEPEIQHAELVGLLQDTAQAGLHLYDGLNISLCRMGCFDKELYEYRG